MLGAAAGNFSTGIMQPCVRYGERGALTLPFHDSSGSIFAARLHAVTQEKERRANYLLSQ